MIADLLLVSSAIAIGFLGAVAFYESLCSRDVLVARVMRSVRRRTSRRSSVALAYGLTVGVGIPILVIAWALLLELALLVVGSIDRLGNVAFVAVAVVAAARILAYIREKTSHELAKAIPLALMFVLLTGGAVNLPANLEAIVAEPDRSDITTTMIAFLVGLEIGLRLLTDGSHRALADFRRRRGLDERVGFWRIAWSGVRSIGRVPTPARPPRRPR